MALLRQYLEMVRTAHGVYEPPPLASRSNWPARRDTSDATSDFTRHADGAHSDNYAQGAVGIRVPARQMRQPSN